MALPVLGFRIKAFDSRRVPKIAKTAASIYHTPEFRAWRAAVIARAGGRCEAVDADRRCEKAAPQHRMFADHREELRDGGAAFDVANGQCLCGAHHTAKTARARADRRGRGSMTPTQKKGATSTR